jgi:hypothetical protein
MNYFSGGEESATHRYGNNLMRLIDGSWQAFTKSWYWCANEIDEKRLEKIDG